MAVLAKVIIYGDIHLCSKGYGAHVDYPKESLQYFSEITRVAKEQEATHIIGTGDLTYGRFNTLEYRKAIEDELVKQNQLTNGRVYEVKGNHDTSTSGMTEYEYYVSKGLLKQSTNLDLGNVHFTMVDYGKYKTTEPNIVDKDTDANFIIAHDYYKFKDTQLPNYGTAIELDNMEKWYGADYLLCGHVHKIMNFTGSIIKGERTHDILVHYLGCMTRPSYREGFMDDIGNIACITINDDGKVIYDVIEIPLWELKDSFNLEEKKKEKEKKIEKENRVDISDIVQQLNTHERVVGNPEDIIAGMQGISEEYKNKAIQLLKDA